MNDWDRSDRADARRGRSTLTGRPPGDAKAIVVAALWIGGSFGLTWPLVTRTPLRSIL